MPCKLPSDLIQPPARRLRDVAIGETVYVTFTSMEVDAEGFCYLDPNSVLYERSRFYLQVVRKEDGFHVTVLRDWWKWQPGRSLTEGWYPVESITRDPQADLLK